MFLVMIASFCCSSDLSSLFSLLYLFNCYRHSSCDNSTALVVISDCKGSDSVSNGAC